MAKKKQLVKKKALIRKSQKSHPAHSTPYEGGRVTQGEGVIPENKRPAYMKKGARYYEAVDKLSDAELGKIVDEFGHPDWSNALKILRKREHDRAINLTVKASTNSPEYTTKEIDGIEYESFARFDQDSRFTTWRQAARYRREGYGGVITNAESIEGEEGHKVRVWKSKEKLTGKQMEALLRKMRTEYLQIGYNGYAGICRKCDSKIKEFIHEAEYSRIHYGSCRCKQYAYEDFTKGMHGGLVEFEDTEGGRL